MYNYSLQAQDIFNKNEYFDLLTFKNVSFTEGGLMLMAECPITGETIELIAGNDYPCDEDYIYSSQEVLNA